MRFLLSLVALLAFAGSAFAQLTVQIAAPGTGTATADAVVLRIKIKDTWAQPISLYGFQFDGSSRGSLQARDWWASPLDVDPAALATDRWRDWRVSPTGVGLFSSGPYDRTIDTRMMMEPGQELIVCLTNANFEYVPTATPTVYTDLAFEIETLAVVPSVTSSSASGDDIPPFGATVTGDFIGALSFAIGFGGQSATRLSMSGVAIDGVLSDDLSIGRYYDVTVPVAQVGDRFTVEVDYPHAPIVGFVLLGALPDPALPLGGTPLDFRITGIDPTTYNYFMTTTATGAEWTIGVPSTFTNLLGQPLWFQEVVIPFDTFVAESSCGWAGYFQPF